MLGGSLKVDIEEVRGSWRLFQYVDRMTRTVQDSAERAKYGFVFVVRCQLDEEWR